MCERYPCPPAGNFGYFEGPDARIYKQGHARARPKPAIKPEGMPDVKFLNIFQTYHLLKLIRTKDFCTRMHIHLVLRFEYPKIAFGHPDFNTFFQMLTKIRLE